MLPSSALQAWTTMIMMMRTINRAAVNGHVQHVRLVGSGSGNGMFMYFSCTLIHEYWSYALAV